MQIRTIGPREARKRRAELSKLLRAALSGSLSARTRSFEGAIRETLSAAGSADAVTVIAEEAGLVLGVVVALPTDRAEELFVLWIAVHPEHRRRGVGRLLVDGLEQSTAAGSVDGLVNPDDPVATAFWVSIGYEVPIRGTRRVRLRRPFPAEAPCGS